MCSEIVSDSVVWLQRLRYANMIHTVMLWQSAGVRVRPLAVVQDYLGRFNQSAHFGQAVRTLAAP
jgi:hypothetical protein